MDELNPIYRIEFFLDAIVNNTTPPEPIYRVEFYLAKIAGADVEIPEPVYRMEKYLAYLCGEEVELPDPIYRIEYYLAFLCGLNVELPEPIYRVEFWLWDWCGGGGIEKTVTGNPIHILDALAKPAQALSVKLEPIQDLNGYDSPWPAGGGKNKFAPYTEVSSNNGIEYSVNSNGTIHCEGTAGPSSSYNGTNPSYADAPLFLKAGTYTVTATGFSATGGAQGYLQFGARYADDTLVTSGGVRNGSATFVLEEDAHCYYWIYVQQGRTVNEDIYIQVEEGSTSTDWTPYSNLCPISGHTDADVVRTGKNLLDPTKQTEDLSTRKRWYWSEGFLLKANTQYTFAEFHEGSGAVTVYFMPMDSVAGLASGTHSATYTPSEDTLVRFQVERSGGIPDGTVYQLSVGSTATSYSPYVGTTYPIPLGTTVYGGTLDVLTGVLTVTHKVADMGQINFDKSSATSSVGGSVFVRALQNVGDGMASRERYTPIDAQSEVFAKCTEATWYVASMPDNSFFYNDITLYVAASAYSTAAEFNTAMSGVKFFYPLATPQTIQLTPTQVELLQGENNLFSDGEMTLVYLADGNASDVEALNILLGGRYVNNHGEGEPTDREALNIILGGNER